MVVGVLMSWIEHILLQLYQEAIICVGAGALLQNENVAVWA